jgi:hypothetical protein
MPYLAYAINVMIGSPGDVQEEHVIIRNAIHGWNVAHSLDRRLVLVPVSWKTNATPQMGDRAQGIINKQLLENCDLFIGVFWTRIGTPTGEAESGTVEEIERHLAVPKPAMIYFSSAPLPPDNLDSGQYNAVVAFKERCRRRGLIEAYKSTQDFAANFGRHLAQTISREFGNLNVELPAGSSDRRETDLLAEVEGLMPELLKDLPENLREHPFLRDIVYTRTKGIAYGWPGIHLRFSEDEIPGIRDKLKVLANGGLLADRGDEFAYKITENFARMLRGTP